MKIVDLINAKTVIEECGLTQLKVSPRFSYILQKNIRKMRKELENFDRARIEGLESLGSVLVPEEKRYMIPTDRQAEWEKMYAELMETELDLDAHLIPLSLMQRDFDRIGVRLDAEEMAQLEWMILDDLGTEVYSDSASG